MHENEIRTHRRATQHKRACYREHLVVHLVSGALGQQRPDRSSEHQRRETLFHDRSVLPVNVINGSYRTRASPVALRGALPCP